MNAPTIIAGSFWVVTSALHLLSIALVWARLRRPRLQTDAAAGSVSLVRTVCGIENHVEESLRSGFRLTYPAYEQIFCAHSETDPIVPMVRRLMAEYPLAPSQLLFGDAAIGANPKLNNMAKGLPAAKGEWIIFCDGNVILEADYIQQLLGAWRGTTGVVSTIHIGTQPENFWADVECAFLNPYHARWHIAAACIGRAYVHGKTMLMRRSDLQQAGGMEALSGEIAEDVAINKLVRNAGRSIDTPFAPVAQPLGIRSVSDVFSRQARWSRLRQRSYPFAFLPEILSSGLFSIAAAAILAHGLGWSALLAAMAQAVGWYGAEMLFLLGMGWPVSWRSVPALVLRDAAIPVLWFYAFIGRDFRWGEKTVFGRR